MHEGRVGIIGVLCFCFSSRERMNHIDVGHDARSPQYRSNRSQTTAQIPGPGNTLSRLTEHGLQVRRSLDDFNSLLWLGLGCEIENEPKRSAFNPTLISLACILFFLLPPSRLNLWNSKKIPHFQNSLLLLECAGFKQSKSSQINLLFLSL